ncbi:hypothetical protein ASE01_09090 [Nocardioides sp. Root190]|uniref:hypothetical protein n=1 Tax=Nocardioides sp. Root190 TaxID=1736488 RepID=UPI0006F296BA|nr:hypothetical protein [Nocardioides sp. Root190]KRB76914.1 hypothetical protein ASE01_09090 [Nocardioides sp. Root190]
MAGDDRNPVGTMSRRWSRFAADHPLLRVAVVIAAWAAGFSVAFGVEMFDEYQAVRGHPTEQAEVLSVAEVETGWFECGKGGGDRVVVGWRVADPADGMPREFVGSPSCDDSVEVGERHPVVRVAEGDDYDVYVDPVTSSGDVRRWAAIGAGAGAALAAAYLLAAALLSRLLSSLLDRFWPKGSGRRRLSR